jgi:hypothetical protein
LAILQALNWAMNAASWNVFFECKFEYCDMRAETWIVDPEGAATTRERPINAFLKQCTCLGENKDLGHGSGGVKPGMTMLAKTTNNLTDRIS